MTGPGTGAKHNAYRFGRWAERAGCWRLRLAGYRILRRGYRAAGAEIDIIARRGNVLAFVEVKARASLNEAAHALGPSQRRRIERAAGAFLAHHPQHGALDARFDLIVMAPGGWPRHQAAAWMLGE